MAIETQHHSSNLLFLNRKEEENFSLQSQVGDFLNQTNMLFNNEGTNQRKRGRDTNNYQLPMQSQFPQVLDLSLLHNNHQHPSSSNMVYTGLRLSSGEDQTQKSHNRNLISDSSSSGFLSVLNEDIIAAHINRQNKELDEFLHAQVEELRRTLAEKRNKHYNALLSAVEGPLVNKLREKEAEIERATRLHNELVARDAQLTAESQAWQARASWHEAAAASLQAQLQKAVDRRGSGGGTVSAQDSRVADEVLLCAAGLEDTESAYVDPERMRRPRCKACRRNEATVVILPCRHLSICPECDRRALACPVCLTLRNSSVEAILC